MSDQRETVKNILGVQDLLRAYLLAATRNAADADDLLQNVLVTLWEKAEAYDGARPFRAWALGFARIEVLRWRETAARAGAVFSVEALNALTRTAEERGQALDERRRFLESCLGRLSTTVRDLLRQRYLEARSVAQIAAGMGSTAAAIEKALVRARAALRDCMTYKAQGARE